MGYFIQDLPAGPSDAGLRDPRDCPSGTRCETALAHVETALEQMLSYFGDPLQSLDQAIDADPGWGHPHLLKAALLLTLGEYEPARQAALSLAEADARSRGATGREAAHCLAAHAALDGDWELACARWEGILVQHPRDIAALLFAHLFDFYRGDALNLRRRVERVLPHWDTGVPLHGYVLGMHAFGLEECGHYGQAEDAGRAALEANRRDPWAVHAVTHVFEMQGRHADGTRWLAGRAADWAVDNGFAFHNWFHAALFEMERMDTAAALALYDAHLAPATGMPLQRVDGTAILWRLHLLGVDVRARFDTLRAHWGTETPAAGFYAFNDVHALVAQVGAGDAPGAAAARARLLSALEQPQSCGPTNRRMAAEVGWPLAQAFIAYANADWTAAAEGLLQVRDRAQMFGGSHAQRDILTWTLLDAATRAGRPALAQHVLNERRIAKGGTPLTAHWQARIGQAMH
jgi:tetratricopeptide (TPR) repeat protein